MRRRSTRTRIRAPKKYSRTTMRTNRLVTGHTPLTGAERAIRSGASMATTVSRLVKDVSNVVALVNSETKFNDVSLSGIDPVTTPVTLLSGIAEGDDYNSRNGRSILGKDLTLRWTFYMQGSISAACRVLIICDKYNVSGALPALSDIFQDPSSTLSAINKNNTDRFVIVKSKLFFINNLSKTVDNGKMYVKIPFHIKFDDVNNNVGSVDNNALYFVVQTDAATTDIDFNLYSRLNFYDN